MRLPKGDSQGSVQPIHPQWVDEFLTEESHISSKDKTIQKIGDTILNSPSLEQLVHERYDQGIRLMGWTKDGSKGQTDISTGNIWIKKTGQGTEPMTLGYECINSQNSRQYRSIGIDYAFRKDTPENREKFAKEILSIEARAMFMKCRLVTELGNRELVKDHYLVVYDDPDLYDEQKVEKLKMVMIEKGLVHENLPVLEFYKGKRYDEIVGYYRDQIKQGKIA